MLQVLASDSSLEDAEEMSVVRRGREVAGHNASRARRDEDEGVIEMKTEIKPIQVHWAACGLAAVVTSLAGQMFWDAHGTMPALVCAAIAFIFLMLMAMKLEVN